MDCRSARASHNMYVYRIQSGYSIIEHYEDDGEHSGGRTILDIVQRKEIINQVVCVTRWYGDKYLGPSRFDHIEEAANSVLQT